MKGTRQENKEVEHHSEISFDEIRAQVAIRHDTLLCKDDPILMTVTLNELVFQRYVDILNEKNDELRKILLTKIKSGKKGSKKLRKEVKRVLLTQIPRLSVA